MGRNRPIDWQIKSASAVKRATRYRPGTCGLAFTMPGQPDLCQRQDGVVDHCEVLSAGLSVLCFDHWVAQTAWVAGTFDRSSTVGYGWSDCAERPTGRTFKIDSGRGTGRWSGRLQWWTEVNGCYQSNGRKATEVVRIDEGAEIRPDIAAMRQSYSLAGLKEDDL